MPTKSNMIDLMTIYIGFLLLNRVRSNLNGNCYLDGVASSHWLAAFTNEPVKDSERQEFKRFLVKNITSVRVQGIDYAKYFEAKLNNDYISVIPTAAFEEYERNEINDPDPEMNVDLFFECEDGLSRKLAFYQPIIDTNTYTPKFVKSSHTYSLAMPFPADINLNTFGEAIAACDFDISNMKLEFEIEPSENVSLDWEATTDGSSKCHVALLKTTNWLRLSSDRKYEIIVRDMGNPSKSSSATLYIKVDEKTSLPLNPHFEMAYYVATYIAQEKTHSIEIHDSIRLKNRNSNTKIKLLGEYKDNFFAKVFLDEVIVKLKRYLSKDTLTHNFVIFVTIEATTEGAEGSGRTVLAIYLPTQECMDTATPEPTEIPYIRFQQDNYWFESPDWYLGFLGFVKAMVAPEQDLEYYLESVDDVDLPNQIKYDNKSGRLELVEDLAIGTYSIMATAKALSSKIKTQASVVINIYRDSKEFRIPHSVRIHHIEENREGYIPLCPDSTSACRFKLVKQYPETEQPLFEIYENTLYHAAINRQMKIFENMEPHVTVRLRLENEEKSTFLPKDNVCSYKGTRDWALLPARNAYEANEVLMAIHIDDVNDHPPIFECGERLIVGYPSKELLALLAPPFLAKVVATDLDVGINADIKYTTNSSQFAIHPKTGVVYPKEHAMDDVSTLKFTITATDMDGDLTCGLSSSLEIEIKLLHEEHLVLLVMNNVMLENLNDMLQALSQRLRIKVGYITAAVLPHWESFPFKRFRNNQTKSAIFDKSTSQISMEKTNFYLKAVIYALDTNHIPIKTAQLQKMLHMSQLLDGSIIDKWRMPAESSRRHNFGKSKKCEKFSATAYIVASTTLALMLSFLVIATGTYCFFKNKATKNAKPCVAATEKRD